VSDDVLQVFKLAHPLLALGFIVNLVFLRVRVGNHSPFLLLWLLFWVMALAHWIVVTLFIDPSMSFELRFLVSGSASIFASLFLFLASDFLGFAVGRAASASRARSLIKWGIPCGAALVALLVLPVELKSFVSNALWFLALAIFTGRRGQVVANSSGCVSVLLYVYAGLNLVYFSRESDPGLVLGLWAISVPLKIVLYYAGYAELSTVAVVNKDSRVKAQVSPPPPAPDVSVEFTGFWGFLYILCRLCLPLIHPPVESRDARMLSQRIRALSSMSE